MDVMPPKHDMIDVTDSLEAVDVARSMRFFLFWFVLFPALLILQLVFWLNWAGRIESKDAPSQDSVAWVQKLLLSGPICLAAEVPAQPQPPAEQPADNKVPAAEQPSAQKPAVEPPAEDRPAADRAEIEQGVSEVTGDQQITDPAAVVPAQEEQPSKFNKLMAEAQLDYNWSVGIIKVCNFLILSGAMLYCLILLLCLKISLVGRLGGMFHITKAFLISLFLLLVLVPWQTLLPTVMIGVLWRPEELLDGWKQIDDSVFWQVIYFLRFTGLWLVAMILLFWSRTRFVRWRKATLRRLGVLR